MTKDKAKIDDLIHDLSEELSPVKRFVHPIARITPWVIIALAYMAGVINFLSIRMDLYERLTDEAYVFELFLMGSMGLSAGYAAGWLSIPDMRQQTWILAVPTTLFAAFLMLTLSGMITEGMTMPVFEWHHCFSDTLLMTFVPLTTLLLLARRGATTRPYWMSFMCVLSVGALSWAAMRISCMMEAMTHDLLYHFFPSVIMALIVSALARRLFRW